MATSLTNIIADIRNRADLENDGKHTTDADFIRYANRSIAKLHSKLTRIQSSLFAKQAPNLKSLGDNKLELPSDFYKLVEVSGLIGGTGRFLPAAEADPQDYARLLDQRNRGDAYRQYILGLNVELDRFELTVFPEPTVNPLGFSTDIFVTYVPLRPVLSVGTETLNWPDVWVEWVVLDAAITAMNRDESDPTPMMIELQQLEKIVMQDISDYTPATPNTIRRTAGKTRRSRNRFRGI